MANRKLLLKSYLNQLDSYMLNKEYVLLHVKSPYELRRYYNAKKSGDLKSIIIYEKSNHNNYVSIMDKDVNFIKEFLETLEEKLDKQFKGIKILFHGSNAKLLDEGLVSHTYFTDDLEIALKYGNNIYAINFEKYHHVFQVDYEKNYISKTFIPLEYLMILKKGN